MAVAVTLTLDKTSPARGETVTATYAVTGNAGTPAGQPQQTTVHGVAVIGDQHIDVDTTLTLPGTPAVPPLSETFTVPTVTGLTFVATSNPKVFTALVP